MVPSVCGIAVTDELKLIASALATVERLSYWISSEVLPRGTCGTYYCRPAQARSLANSLRVKQL